MLYSESDLKGKGKGKGKGKNMDVSDNQKIIPDVVPLNEDDNERPNVDIAYTPTHTSTGIPYNAIYDARQPWAVRLLQIYTGAVNRVQRLQINGIWYNCIKFSDAVRANPRSDNLRETTYTRPFESYVGLWLSRPNQTHLALLNYHVTTAGRIPEVDAAGRRIFIRKQ